MKKLTEIANACRTDKGSVANEAHTFTEFYDRYFNEMKERAITEGRKLNILEVGIQYGNSLQMFNEYFGEYANIYGVDINLSNNNYENDKIVLYEVDANDRDSINRFLNDIGNVKFDMILDDASHISEHQIHTLLYLYKSLKNNGLYIIEDLHCGVNSGNDSPLHYLLFKNKLSFMTEEEHNEFTNIINDVIIYYRNNPRAGDGYSITSIITFKE